MGKFVYGIALFAAAAAIAWYGWLAKSFSLPGRVHQAHAGIEADCFACHDDSHGIDDARCASCHTDPATGEKASFQGFAGHHADPSLACRDCHVEHKGRDGSLTRKDKGFEATGCAPCHERHVGSDFAYALNAGAHPENTVHVGHGHLAGDCQSCHDENSRPSSRKCLSCHQDENSKVHKLSGFALHHGDATLDCLECHTEHRRTTMLRHPRHVTVETGCAECHDGHMGKGHDYKLRAAEHPGRTIHRDHERWQADCSACHAENGGLDAGKCRVCHDPKTHDPVPFRGFAAHHTDRALDCLECHVEHRGADGQLTRSDQTLEKIGCDRCHARHMGKDYEYTLPKEHHVRDSLHADHAKWQQDCAVCHDTSGGVQAGKCAACHEPKGGGPVAFHGFAAHHGYKDLNCLDCHTAHRGRDASLLRPGKSFRNTGCATCHTRHVGPDHAYSLSADKHPEDRIRKAHAPWKRECSACHKPDGGYECTKCHDPKTGKQAAVEGFGAHHFRPEMKCRDCHAEHRGEDPKPKTRFADVACSVCHTSDIGSPTPLDDVPRSLRGRATRFGHERHVKAGVACATCHPMKPEAAHVLEGPFGRNCSSCHHGPKPKTQPVACAHCHSETADYFGGKHRGRLIPRGSHGRSGDVACADCHRFDAASNQFADPATTCAACHPKSYVDIFDRERNGWRAWRRELGENPGAALDFIGRNWYHNDAHAERYRKAARKPHSD